MENKVKQLRLARAWSQEQLAQLSSLSTRTIQRIENNEIPSLETLSALASVFNVSVSELTPELLPESIALDSQIEEVKKRVDDEARLLKSIITAFVVCTVLYVVNLFFAPQSHWPIWVVSIWGGLLLVRTIKLFLLDKFLSQWRHKRLMQMTKKR